MIKGKRKEFDGKKMFFVIKDYDGDIGWFRCEMTYEQVCELSDYTDIYGALSLDYLISDSRLMDYKDIEHDEYS